MSVKTSVFHSPADIIEAVALSGRVAVREISGENTSGGDIFVQVYDLNAVPANGVTTQLFAPVRVPSGKRYDMVFDVENFLNGFIFENGVTVVASSTKYTKTSVLVASMDLQVLYEENIIT
jgi:hypothetical protein